MPTSDFSILPCLSLFSAECMPLCFSGRPAAYARLFSRGTSPSSGAILLISPHLLQSLRSTSADVVKKALYATATLVRNNHLGQQLFYHGSGVKILESLIAKPFNTPILRKALDLLHDLADAEDKHLVGFCSHCLFPTSHARTRSQAKQVLIAAMCRSNSVGEPDLKTRASVCSQGPCLRKKSSLFQPSILSRQRACKVIVVFLRFIAQMRDT